MYIFGIAFFVISLLSHNPISALLQSDDPGQGGSGRSFDDILQMTFRILPTRLVGGDDTIRVQKGTALQGWSQYLNLEYPTKNILIYYNQSSIFEGVNTTQRTVEFTSNNDTRDHTYQIQLFDTGTFTLAGEYGYHNWAFCGNWSQNGRSVEFFPLTDLSKISTSGSSAAKMGGGYIPQNLENTARLSIRDSPPCPVPVPDGWSATYNENANDWSLVDDDASQEIQPEITVSAEEGAAAEIEEISGELGPELTADLAGLGPVGWVVIGIIWATISAILTVIALWGDIMGLVNRNKHERAYTQSTVSMLAGITTTKNVIVFHNQDSTVSFGGASHIHYELNLHEFSSSEGYEIYVFDYGNFTLSGDGGFENWAFSGNYAWEEGSASVSFYPRPGGPCSPALKSRDDSGKQLRIRQPIPPVIPTRENPETTDGYYFVTCEKPDKRLSLGIAYYEDMEPGGANIGQLPDHFVEVHSNHAGMKAWQGQGHVIFDALGTSFEWNFVHTSWIDDALVIGIASTAFEQFWVYKDAGELLFNTTASLACRSLSYAF